MRLRIAVALEKLARRIRPIQPVRAGHTYRSEATGERFVVTSVAPNVTIERKDAERRPEHSVKLDTLRRAIETKAVVHDADTCPSCQ